MRQAKTLLVSLTMLLTASLLFALPAAAQSPSPVTAQVDRREITTDDTLLLTITVDGQGSASQPLLPALDGFQVAGTSSSQSISIVNGVTRAQISYLVYLQPTRAGDLVIGPVTVSIDGQSHSTEPIAVTVHQGTGQPQPMPTPAGGMLGVPGSPALPPSLLGPNLDPWSMDPMDLLSQLSQWNLFDVPPVGLQPMLDAVEAPTELAGQDFFVEAQVDHPNPYQGQQVLYTVRFYQALETLGSVDYQPPTFTGLWSHDVPEQAQYTTQAAGRTYRVTELKTLLFPTVSGQVTIDPARLAIAGGLFGPSQTLQTQAVQLEVQPLPANAPADFSGAVGRFSIQARLDGQPARVGDTTTLQVTVSGQGNIDALPDPNWPAIDGFRAFDGQSSTESQVVDDQFVGTRSYERLLVPTVDGELTLPPISYTYFDPATGAYETTRTDPMALAVAPNGNASSSPSPVVAAAIASSTNAPAAELSLRGLKPAPEVMGGTVPLTQRPAYWLLWIVPLALIGGQAIWQRRQRHWQSSAVQRRSKNAARRARQALQDARRQRTTAGLAAGRILTEYLSARFGCPVAGLTRPELLALLQQQEIEPSLAAWTADCLARAEASSYAPQAEDGDERLDEVEQVIQALEGSMA